MSASTPNVGNPAAKWLQPVSAATTGFRHSTRSTLFTGQRLLQRNPNNEMPGSVSVVKGISAPTREDAPKDMVEDIEGPNGHKHHSRETSP